LLIGAALGHMEHGLVSSLGGMALLYTPSTSLPQRMGMVMACAMGMTTCFALGLVAAFHPLFLIPLITVVTVLVTLVCRIYGVDPPGSLFFVMASAIAACTPFSLMEIPFRVGLVVLGSAFGLLGGWFIHHQKSRALLLRGLVVLWPWRWGRLRSRAPD
jgi:hypothetical protein